MFHANLSAVRMSRVLQAAAAGSLALLLVVAVVL